MHLQKLANMKKNILISAISALLIVSNHTSASSGNKNDDLFDLSLEELLNLKVSIASKTEESVYSAPSSVTVFTREQIRRMGVEDVYHLLNYVPGFQTTRSVDLTDEKLIHVRGVGSIDSHVLVLLNGVRMNETSFGRATLYNRYLTTDNVKRVEVIRGPGSALYGGNAFLGVVNIITENKSNEAGLLGGSDGKAGIYVNSHKQFNDEFSGSFSLSYVQDNGQNYRINNTETDDPFDNLNLYARTTYGDLTFDLAYMEYNNEDFIAFNAIAPSGVTWTSTKYLMGSLKYTWEVNDKFKLEPNLSFTQHKIKHVGLLRPARPPMQSNPLYSGPFSRSTNIEASLDGSWEFDDSNELLAGLSYRKDGVDYLGAYTNHITPDNSMIAPADPFYLGEVIRFKQVGQLDSRERYINVNSAYVQYKRVWFNSLTTFLGARYDHYKVVGSTINPRVGFIYKADETNTLKLLYGTAFRAPTNQELFTDSPRSLGNENLEPEEVSTYELIYQKGLGKGFFEATIFENELKNIINVDIGGGVGGRNTWKNQGGGRYKGLEAALHYQLNANWNIQLAHTHIFSKIADNTYNDFGSFSVNYNTEKWNFNVNGIYRDQQEDTLVDQDDYVVVDTKLIYKHTADIKVYGMINNLFDTDYDTYENKFTSNSNAVPNRGFAFSVGIEISFQ